MYPSIAICGDDESRVLVGGRPHWRLQALAIWLAGRSFRVLDDVEVGMQCRDCGGVCGACRDASMMMTVSARGGVCVTVKIRGGGGRCVWCGQYCACEPKSACCQDSALLLELVLHVSGISADCAPADGVDPAGRGRQV